MHTMRVESTVLNGVPDCYVSVRNAAAEGSPFRHHSMWIEIKCGKDPVRPIQAVWHIKETMAGGRVAVARFGLDRLTVAVWDGVELIEGAPPVITAAMEYPLDKLALARFLVEQPVAEGWRARHGAGMEVKDGTIE
ncbi:MAG: hypothetical protein ACRDGA_03040 [Bacteroidota bacterium]